MRSRQQREIFIINNEVLNKFITRLGKPSLNSWYPVNLNSDNTINLSGIDCKVEFIDDSEGDWFEIVEVKDKIFRLKKWNNFSLIQQ